MLVKTQGLCLLLMAVHGVYAQQDSVKKTIHMDEVVVTGQFEPTSIKNSVFKVRSITQDQIIRRSTADITTLLNTELGVRFSNDLTLGETDIQLMGMSGQNVKILLDGIPLLDRGSTKQSLSQIDINSIEKIEIVEGPVSVIYGTDALAGVINIITKKNYQYRWQIQARLLEETVNDEYNLLSKEGKHNAHLNLGYQLGDWQVGISGTRNTFGGYQGKLTGRALAWQPKDQYLTAANVAYRKGKQQTWYRVDYVNEDIFTPGNFTANNKYIDKHYLTNRWTHQLQSDWKLNANLSINGSLSYQDYKRETTSTITDITTQQSNLTTGTGEQDIAHFQSFFARGTLQYKSSAQLFFQTGVEYNWDKGSGARIEGSPVIKTYAAFLSAEYTPFSWLNLRPGVRVLTNSAYDAPPIIPSLNTKIKINEFLDLRSAYARGFRSPALREMYFSFFDSNHSIRGNENLKAEYSNSFNSYLSYHQHYSEYSEITSSIGGFYNIFDNLIMTGVDPTNASVTTYLNVEKYKTTGLIWENAYTYKQLQASLGISYIGRYNKLSEAFKETEKFLWSPEISGSIFYAIPRWSSSINFFYKYYGARPGYEALLKNDGDLQIKQTRVSGFHQADFSINKNIGKQLILNVGVRNLFNTMNINSSSAVGEGAHSTSSSSIPMSYGRSYFLGLNYSLTK